MASSVPGPSADPAPRQVRLQSSDGEIFTVDVKVAKVSKVLKEMLENMEKAQSIDSDTDTEKGASASELIPVEKTPGKILRRVLVWAEHYQDEVAPPTPTRDEHGELLPDKDDDDVKVELNDWDAEFFKVGRGVLFDIVLASNYLDMQGLLKKGCKAIANLMTGKSAQEMREILKVSDDLTPAQKEQIQKENDWAERASVNDGKPFP